MKKIVFLLLLLSSLIVHAINVRVFFTNKTAETFRPVGGIMYKKNGVRYDNIAIEPPIPVIDAFAQQVKIDIDRKYIDIYFMEWLELNDEQNRYKLACLDSYVAVSKSSDIYFTLSMDDEIPDRYICHHKVVLR